MLKWALLMSQAAAIVTHSLRLETWAHDCLLSQTDVDIRKDPLCKMHFVVISCPSGSQTLVSKVYNDVISTFPSDVYSVLGAKQYNSTARVVLTQSLSDVTFYI